MYAIDGEAHPTGAHRDLPHLERRPDVGSYVLWFVLALDGVNAGLMSSSGM